MGKLLLRVACGTLGAPPLGDVATNRRQRQSPSGLRLVNKEDVLQYRDDSARADMSEEGLSIPEPDAPDHRHDVSSQTFAVLRSQIRSDVIEDGLTVTQADHLPGRRVEKQRFSGKRSDADEIGAVLDD